VASAYGWVTIVILSMVKRAHTSYSNRPHLYHELLSLCFIMWTNVRGLPHINEASTQIILSSSQLLTLVRELSRKVSLYLSWSLGILCALFGGRIFVDAFHFWMDEC
jgi:hypothetical protein